MPKNTHDWPRNIDGLRKSAHERSAAVRHRAEEAIALLVREHRPITFRAVAHESGVSSAWLYQHDDIKVQIMQLRHQQLTPKISVPAQEPASDLSKDNLLRMLSARVKRLEAENKDLRKQLEVAYGYVATGRTPPQPSDTRGAQP